MLSKTRCPIGTLWRSYNAGFERTYKQCRDKVKALKKCYEDIADRLRRSGLAWNLTKRLYFLIFHASLLSTMS